jgi:hypothetical protein
VRVDSRATRGRQRRKRSVYCRINNISIPVTVVRRDPGAMKNTWIIVVALAMAPANSGCGGEPASGSEVSDPVVSPPTETPTAPAGFPCDVYAVLQGSCASCHAGRLYYGPNFDSRDDLFRAATELFVVQTKPVAPGSFGEHIGVALGNHSMPPYGSPAMPSPAERNLVIAWVASGMPAGACGGLSATPTP